MIALILNSGVGSRMKDLATCKCLVELAHDTTIFDEQINALLRCGVNDICITTGAYADLLESYARERYPQACFTFINNPLYNETNYIYSINLAEEFLRDNDVIIMHGDIVFEQSVLQDVIASSKSVMVVDSTKPLPEKDFKATIENGRITSINVAFGEVYAQPLYKLTKKDWTIWLNEIVSFCDQNKTTVYAENAFNNVSNQIELYPLDVFGRSCFEVDNIDDLTYAKKVFSQLSDRLQTTYSGFGSIKNIKTILANAKKPMIVCHDSFLDLIDKAVYFSEFTPNPRFEEITKGIQLFKEHGCDFIVSIGGGSAIDVAKCINMLDRETPRACHLAIPTTAGTGSEATKFAVVYKDGKKLSIEHEHMLPNIAILDPEFLKTLPDYHKKSTILDTLCHAVESLWAKGRTAESITYAKSALRIVWEDADSYMANDVASSIRMLHAANLSGKAINISKTTAAHAMSYELSSLFNISHGHAVSLCLPVVWKHLLDLNAVPDTLTSNDYVKFVELAKNLSLAFDRTDLPKHFDRLVSSVNSQRLSNHPVLISTEQLYNMYHAI